MILDSMGLTVIILKVVKNIIILVNVKNVLKVIILLINQICQMVPKKEFVNLVEQLQKVLPLVYLDVLDVDLTYNVMNVKLEHTWKQMFKDMSTKVKYLYLLLNVLIVILIVYVMVHLHQVQIYLNYVIWDVLVKDIITDKMMMVNGLVLYNVNHGVKDVYQIQ